MHSQVVLLTGFILSYLVVVVILFRGSGLGIGGSYSKVSFHLALNLHFKWAEWS